MPQSFEACYEASDHRLTITARTVPGDGCRAHVHLAGEIDIASCAVLSATVDWLTALAPVSVLVDLSEVAFASAALPNFVTRVRHAVPHGAELVLCRARPATGWVLRVTDMATIASVRDEITKPVDVGGQIHA